MAWAAGEPPSEGLMRTTLAVVPGKSSLAQIVVSAVVIFSDLAHCFPDTSGLLEQGP